MKERNLLDFLPIIEKAVESLKNGETRIGSSGNTDKFDILHFFGNPDFSERISSDYGLKSPEYEDIAEDYLEEIECIEKLISEADIPIRKAEWQKTRSESGDKMFKSLNLRNLAIQLWDWYAIPWRLKNGFVYIIYAPHDILGTPVVHCYSVNEFVQLLTHSVEEQAREVFLKEKQLKYWKNIASVAIFVLIIVAYSMFI